MTIIEYKLDPQDADESYHPRTIPSYVIDGGYWSNPDNYKLIGIGLEGSIPDDIETFTLAKLQARQRAIHAKYPMKVGRDEDSDDMTDTEVNTVIKTWMDIKFE